MTEQVDSRRRPPRRAAAAAVLLAIGAGVVALGVRGGDPPQPPVTAVASDVDGPDRTESRPPPAARSDAPAPKSLTTGPMMSNSVPVRLDLPKLRVSSSLVDLGLQADDTMEVPADGGTAGWFTAAPTPGALGPAVIAAHVNWKGKPGVFARLATLRPGDTARVARRDGSVAVFQVTQVRQYPKNRFPTDAVYGTINHAGLRLITCGGDYDSSRRSYVDNIVVFARLAGTERS